MFYEPKSARSIGEMVKNKIEADNAQRRQETRTTLLKSAAARNKTVNVPPRKFDPPPKPPSEKQRLELQRAKWAEEDRVAKLEAIRISLDPSAESKYTALAKAAKAHQTAFIKSGSFFPDILPETKNPTSIAVLLAARKARTPTNNPDPPKGSAARAVLDAGRKRRGEI